MDDRPSLGPTLLRVVVAAACFLFGFEHVSHQADAFHEFVVNQALPLPAGAVRWLGVLELVCGVILLLGLATRFAALCLLIVAGVSMVHTLQSGDTVHLIGPGVLLLACLLLIGLGGGRWALLDRVDPPRPRRLARE